MKKVLIIVLVGVIALIGIVTGVYYWLYPIKYQTTIIETAKKYDIEPALIASIINAESSFDKNKVSPKNAIGLMQVLPSTANYIGGEAVDLYNPEQNIEIGTRYLAYLIKKFGDVDTALFAYNAGEGNVAKWLNEQGVNKLTTCPFPETNAYVKKIKRTINFYRSKF